MLKRSIYAFGLQTRRSFINVSCRSMSTLPAELDNKQSGSHFQLKTPKGTRDYNEKEMAVREKLFNTITNVFQRHGAVTIDTPVFEMRDILAGKYGEDSKLIYDLANQGGEDCSLRYDLTVPFARYLAMTGAGKKAGGQQLKRYQIAKVYRRDQPVMTKGRLREFYQCDFDIAGAYDRMIPDAEILKILCETLDAVQIPFHIKLNHRQILDGIFEICGVAKDQIRSISSAVDKLDKLSWQDVKKEMTTEKGLDPISADRIGKYVQELKQKDAPSLLEFLQNDDSLMAHEGASQGIEDVKLLLDYLKIFGVQDKVKLDLSLARGLDYYTGIIYEAVQTESEGVGSIAAGGRYDTLVGMFSGTNKAGKPKTIPCVGISIGIERLFSILTARQDLDKIKGNKTNVFVISVGDGLLKERMKLVNELWDAGIQAQFMMKNKPKLEKQWAACEKDQIPFAVIVGKDELEKGQVKIKDMREKDESQGGGSITNRDEMVKVLKDKIRLLQLEDTCN